jgi:chorismate-pyruvate lyase
MSDSHDSADLEPTQPQPGSHGCENHTNCVTAEEMIAIYYEDAMELGSFRRVTSEQVPELYRNLLNHTNHMTVTVESYHASPVDVEVLRSDFVDGHYRREILLKTQSKGLVVQYGIVQLNTKYLSEGPRREILSHKKPLGRVLIEHNVMREIELFALLEVHCGRVLARAFDVPEGTVTYGRTALLHCDNDPAIELLEIVRPSLN